VFTVETKNATEAIKRFLGDDGAAGENKWWKITEFLFGRNLMKFLLFLLSKLETLRFCWHKCQCRGEHKRLSTVHDFTKHSTTSFYFLNKFIRSELLYILYFKLLKITKILFNFDVSTSIGVIHQKKLVLVLLVRDTTRTRRVKTAVVCMTGLSW